MQSTGYVFRLHKTLCRNLVPSPEGVSVKPGKIAVTLTLYFDSSCRNTWLRLSKPDLVTL